MKTQAIIPTAGLGLRFRMQESKPLVLLKEKPIFVHTLEAFENCDCVQSVILVVHKEQLGEFEKVVLKYRLSKVAKIVAGGKTRCESVSNAINILDKDTDIVLVHDGVRPVVSKKIIEDSINSCVSNDAVVVAVPVKPTIKKVDAKELVVKSTLNRDELWEIQTPQVFKKSILIDAYQKRSDDLASDDASLVEALGVTVGVVQGDYRNIKITTDEDLYYAQMLIERKLGAGA